MYTESAIYKHLQETTEVEVAITYYLAFLMLEELFKERGETESEAYLEAHNMREAALERGYYLDSTAMRTVEEKMTTKED